MILTFKQFINESPDLDTKLKKLGLKRTNKFGGVGKEIGGEIYLHKNYENTLPHDQFMFAKGHLPQDYDYQVVKYNPKTITFSFIQSKDFDTNDEPSVNSYVTVKSDGTIKQGKDSGWIWHHKWMWVADDYKGFDVEASKERSLKWSSLDGVDKARIGQRKHWNDNVVPRLQESNETVKFMKNGTLEIRDSKGKLLKAGTSSEINTYIKTNKLTPKFLHYDPFDEDLTEAIPDKNDPRCVGTLYSSIIIVFPGSNIRYHYDLGSLEIAEKYRRLCSNYGAGKYIKKFKQYPMKTVKPLGE